MARLFFMLAVGAILSGCAADHDGMHGTNPAQAGAALEGRDWHVEDIAGRGVIDDSHLTLTFGADGRLSGSGGCNRIIGSFVRDGTKLIVNPAGTTMMACAPALMKQEAQLMRALDGIRSYAITKTGMLKLTGPDGALITAR